MKKKRINDTVLASIPVQNGQILKGEHLAILREILSAAINENNYDINRIVAGQDAVHVYGEDVEVLDEYVSENPVVDETLGYLHTENQILLYTYLEDTNTWLYLGVLNLTELFNKTQELDAHTVDLENANMFKDVNYNNVNGVLTFTKYDNTTKAIDLPLELLVESGYYDEATNELVLVLANSSEIRIPVGDLLTDLDAHNIRFNGSGTNYLTAKTEVEGAIKELDTQVALKVNVSDIMGYNDSMPDLSTATDLGGGDYRLYNQFDITVDYNVNSGIWTIDGLYSGLSNIAVSFSNDNYRGIVTGQMIVIGGTPPVGGGDGWRFASNSGIDNRITYDGAGGGYVKTADKTAGPNILLRFLVGQQFTNFQFKLQLEKGDTASPYTLPGQMPQVVEGAIKELDIRVKDNADTIQKKADSIIETVAYVDSNGNKYTYRQIFEDMNMVSPIDSENWVKSSPSSITFNDDVATIVANSESTSLSLDHQINTVSGNNYYNAVSMREDSNAEVLYWRTNYSSTTGLKFSGYDELTFLSGIIVANVTGSSFVKYQQNNGTPSILSFSYTQGFMIDLSIFETEPSKELLDVLLKEYLNCKKNKSSVLSAKKLTGTSYIDDNIYVQLSQVSANEKQIIIYKQTNYNEDYYLGSKFRNLNDISIRSNTWVRDEVSLYVKNEESFIPIENTTFIQVGEWDCAIRQVGKDDFMGGIAHGDEIMIEEVILIDGYFINTNDTFLKTAKKVEFLINSNLYEMESVDNIVALHNKHIIVTKEKITVSQKVIYNQELTLQSSFLAMCPVERVITADLSQVTNKAFYDEDYEIVTIDGVAPRVRKTNATYVSVYNDGLGHQFNVSMKQLKYSQLPDNNKWITDSSTYNKIYFDYVGTGETVTVDDGDVWESVVEYYYDYNGFKDEL